MVEPILHWVVAKHVLMYLQGTMEYGLRYVRSGGVQLLGYTGSDWAGSAVDRKSTSGRCFNLGSTVISWFRRKQMSMELSSAKAEYMAISLVCSEVIWVRKMLTSLFGQEL